MVRLIVFADTACSSCRKVQVHVGTITGYPHTDQDLALERRLLAGLKMTLDQRVGKPCVCCEMSTLQPPSNLKLLEGSELSTTPGIDPDPSKCLMNFKQQTVLVS